MAATDRKAREPWVLVAGDFAHTGGMDRANATLADYLCASGRQVHLVGFRIDSDLAARPQARPHLAKQIAGSDLLSAGQLSRLGQRVAQVVLARYPDARVLVNGTNCDLPDINWIHCVHHAWARNVKNAPFWYKAKSALSHWIDCEREGRILPRARTLIANSERTRRDLIERVGVDPSRVHTIYLGTNEDWRTITPERRAIVRKRYRITPERPLVIFVGAMGYDEHKGFDTLWEAWKEMCIDPEWDAELLAAGSGRALPMWRKAIVKAGLERRVRLLGFIDNVPDLLAAADLLVSPVRYESYGLNVQEALTCGVPAIVTVSAGVAERYPPELTELLLVDPEDPVELAARLRRWYARREQFKRLTERLAVRLRQYSWRDMAERIVSLAENSK